MAQNKRQMAQNKRQMAQNKRQMAQNKRQMAQPAAARQKTVSSMLFSPRPRRDPARAFVI